jgi:hypothetical protein
MRSHIRSVKNSLLSLLLLFSGFLSAQTTNSTPSDEQLGIYAAGVPAALIQNLREVIGDGHKIRSAYLGPANSYIFVFGENGWKSDGVPGNLLDTMVEIKKQNPGTEIRDVSVAPNGGWIFLWGQNGASWNSVPEPLSSLVKQHNDSESKLQRAKLIPDEGYAFAFNTNGYSVSGPSKFVDAVKGANADGSRMSDFAVGPDGAWVVVLGDNGYSYNDIPSSMGSAIKQVNSDKRDIHCVALGPNGSWLLVSAKNQSQEQKSLPPGQQRLVAHQSDDDDHRSEIEHQISKLRQDISNEESMLKTYEQSAEQLDSCSSGLLGAICAAKAQSERRKASESQAKIERDESEMAELSGELGGGAGGSGGAAGEGGGGGGTYVADRHYSGPYSGEVERLLSESSGWSCPTSATQSVKWVPPFQQVCMRDSYITAAVALAYGAECESRLGRDQQAAQDAKDMEKNIGYAKSMCSHAAHFATSGPDCSTAQIVPCP